MCVCHLSVFFCCWFLTCRIHQKNNVQDERGERTLTEVVNEIIFSNIYFGVDESKIKSRRGEESDFWALHRHEILRLQRALFGREHDYYLWLLFRTGKQRRSTVGGWVSYLYMSIHVKSTQQPLFFKNLFFSAHPREKESPSLSL